MRLFEDGLSSISLHSSSRRPLAPIVASNVLLAEILSRLANFYTNVVTSSKHRLMKHIYRNSNSIRGPSD